MNQGYPGEVEGSHPLDQSQHPAEQQQSASEQTQDQPVPAEQPPIEQSLSEQGQGQSLTPEQPQLETPEDVQPVELETKVAEFKDLIDRVQRLVKAGHAGSAESPGGLLSMDNQNGLRVLQETRLEGVHSESFVMLVDGELTAIKNVSTQEGRKILSAKMAKSGNQGKLERLSPDDAQIGQPVALNENHIRAIVERVMGKLQQAVEGKELVASNELDTEVSEILGVALTAS